MRQSPVNVKAASLKTDQFKTDQELTTPTENFSVRGYWVPGTLDRVILQRLDSPVMLEVHSNRVHQLFGRGAMDPLYLTGKSCFDCTVEEWSALKA
jgi:hypothetical protein